MIDKTCKVCKQDMQIKYVPKGIIYPWNYPDNMKPEWFEKREFSLGSDWKLQKDLRYMFCACGYSKYEEIKDDNI